MGCVPIGVRSVCNRDGVEELPDVASSSGGSVGWIDDFGGGINGGVWGFGADVVKNVGGGCDDSLGGPGGTGAKAAVGFPNTDFDTSDGGGTLGAVGGKEPNGFDVDGALVTVGGNISGPLGAAGIGSDGRPNAEVEVEEDGNADLPKTDAVLKTLGVEARPENADMAGVMGPVAARGVS